MTTALSHGSLGSLRARMVERLDCTFKGAMPPAVVEHIAEQLAQVAATWLTERASSEVFDSRGEYVLRRAADEARTDR